MRRLSQPIDSLKSHYKVVVVGSGYGGAISASRLSRAGQEVCVLERGKEYLPGEYPNSPVSALPEFQADLPIGRVGSRDGLYDLRVNNDINVFMGCGLGGTSLINANVALRAEPRVFDDDRWPQALRDNPHRLEDGYSQAERMLKPSLYPDDFPRLAKMQAHQESARLMGQEYRRTPINVTFEDGVNHVGVEQSACRLCGDCVSGCNYSAKNTILMNYLPDASNHGAEIYTHVSVRRVERRGDKWLVHYQPVESGREDFDAPTMFMSADIVILAAGTLGTTEILLRSRMEGLTLSDRLGHGFTGNGDAIGFGYNNDQKINGIGLGRRSPNSKPPVGPCITGVIDIREQPDLDEGMVIEEGSVPGVAMSWFKSQAFATGATFVGKDTDSGVGNWIKKKLRQLDTIVRGAYHGAINNTQVYLVMTHDDSSGRMYLEDDRLRIDWPGVGEQAIFAKANERMKEATRTLGGTYVKNPTWIDLTDHNLTTVHPLGGCSMAENASSGVVNHKGQVFSGTDGSEVHQGLYVFDGSIVPRSLGVNPLLTISALAERNCALLAEDYEWNINYDLPSRTPEEPESLKLGIQFTETMRGYFSTEVTDHYEHAQERGRHDESEFEFTVTVVSDDMDTMLEDPDHEASIVGTVSAGAISDTQLTITGGKFNLFASVPGQPNTRQMLYRMPLATADGEHYYMVGFKTIHDDPGFDMWGDTTTLYITVHGGDDESGSVVGRGILRISIADFRRQMTTISITNAAGLAQEAAASARFGKFFLGKLWDTYGLG